MPLQAFCMYGLNEEWSYLVRNPNSHWFTKGKVDLLYVVFNTLAFCQCRLPVAKHEPGVLVPYQTIKHKEIMLSIFRSKRKRGEGKKIHIINYLCPGELFLIQSWLLMQATKVIHLWRCNMGVKVQCAVRTPRQLQHLMLPMPLCQLPDAIPHVCKFN